MNQKVHHLEFITPCFCAGAEQSKAEIRPPSIRGQLRWWFRVLGGTPEQERRVFGGVHGEVQASSVIVRVANVKPAAGRSPLPGDLNFFTSSRTEAAFAPGTTFDLILANRRTLAEGDRSLLEDAIQAFLLLGTIGLRQGRGCGSFAAVGQAVDDGASLQSFAGRFDGIQLACLAPQDSAVAAMGKLETAIKQFRSEMSMEKNDRNAFGYTDQHSRQASAVRLRPVRMADRTFLPVVYYVPAVLGNDCQPLGQRFSTYRWDGAVTR